MKKVLLLAILAGLGWWYFEGGRKLSEERVREHYRSEAELFASLDAEGLCSTMAAEYRHQDTTHGPRGAERISADKTRACRVLTESMQLFQQLHHASSGRIRPELSYEIRKIELSPDHKQATVELVGTIMLAGRLVTRTRGSERLVRRNGKVLSVAADTRTWVYD